MTEEKYLKERKNEITGRRDGERVGEGGRGGRERERRGGGRGRRRGWAFRDSSRSQSRAPVLCPGQGEPHHDVFRRVKPHPWPAANRRFSTSQLLTTLKTPHFHTSLLTDWKGLGEDEPAVFKHAKSCHSEGVRSALSAHETTALNSWKHFPLLKILFFFGRSGLPAVRAVFQPRWGACRRPARAPGAPGQTQELRARAQVLRARGVSPAPGSSPSPALTGRFSTTEPPARPTKELANSRDFRRSLLQKQGELCQRRRVLGNPQGPAGEPPVPQVENSGELKGALRLQMLRYFLYQIKPELSTGSPKLSILISPLIPSK